MSSSALAVVPERIVALDDWNDARKEFIRQTFCGGAPDNEAAMFIEICKRRRLSPEEKQIYFVSRKQSGRTVWTIQTSIDGYRLIAERTGAYAGSDEPVYEYGPDPRMPRKATVTVWKLVSGVRCPFTASALFDEYCASREGWSLWMKMPHVMIAKCFDADTEVLTDRGFQRFADVSGRVLQVGPDGLAATDARPFSQDYAGPMVTLDSDDLNFSVTPNHDMVTTDGRIEAGAMFDDARARPKHWIPRSVRGSGADAPVSDRDIFLAAAYLADGYDRTGATFAVSVSRVHKVESLRTAGGYIAEVLQHDAGRRAVTAARTITTRKDKVRFSYAMRDVSYLCESGKRVKTDALISLSRRQARVFVDALVGFDGSTQKKSGVRRFYTSRIDHLEAFELASAAAGYAVSRRRDRTSDISRGPNYNVTISDRDEIPVIRWGRSYLDVDRGETKFHRGLALDSNVGGRVWCVTVPSGVIVVRRHGFSMLCGNCAESQALRKAFPADLSGIYTSDEMEQADSDGRATASVAPARPRPQSVTSDGEIVAEPAADPLERARRRLFAVGDGRLQTPDLKDLVYWSAGVASVTEATAEELALVADALDRTEPAEAVAIHAKASALWAMAEVDTLTRAADGVRDAKKLSGPLKALLLAVAQTRTEELFADDGSNESGDDGGDAFSE